MSGGDQDPSAYSTQTNGDGSRADGYRVVIAPGQLDSAISQYKDKLAGQSPTKAGQTLQQSVMGQARFGNIPAADEILQALVSNIALHAQAMRQMHINLDDFVARVQAAAQMGSDSDEATRAVSALVLALGLA